MVEIAGFAIISMILFIFLSIVYSSLKFGISPMPTTYKVKKALLALLPENFQGNIYELGSGWGTLVFPTAKRYPGSFVTALEASIFPYLFSIFFQCGYQRKNVSIRRCDFFNISFEEADMVICYLFPRAMERLRNKFERELHPGAMVVSHTFAIPGWRPTQIFTVQDLYKTKIYLYLDIGTKKLEC